MTNFCFVSRKYNHVSFHFLYRGSDKDIT